MFKLQFRRLLLFLLILLFFLPPNSLIAAESNSQTDKKIFIHGNPPIKGPLIKAANSINLDGQIDGDVYLFAGEVNINAYITGDLTVFAGQINLQGQVDGDTRLFGASLDLDSSLKDDALFIGGQVIVSPETAIQNSLIILAGKTRFAGRVFDNAYITTGDLDLLSQASIQGDLVLKTDSSHLSPEATISGKLTQKPFQKSTANHQPQPSTQKITRAFISFYLLKKMIEFISYLVIGWLIILLLPKFSADLVKTSIKKPIDALGWGILALIFTPLLALFLLISLIGIPLAFLTLILFGFSFYLAGFIASLSLGTSILKDTQHKKPYQAYFIGLLILFLVKHLPLIGWLVYFMAFLIGLGSITLAEKKYFETLKKKS